MRLTDLDKCDRKLFYKQAGGWDSLITVKAAFDMLDSLPVEELPVFKWIPVSERLPENRKQEVLISLEWGIDIGRYSDGEWHSEWINHYDDGNVLAWMPLPKPYEPQGRSDKE